jgi:predicted transcriptional regulator
MNYIKKLSLYIKKNNIDGDLDFDVWPATQDCSENDGMYVFNWNIDTRYTFGTKVRLLKNQGHQSNIRIEKVELNNITLNDLDRWAKYITQKGDIVPGTYGYMNIEGEYRLKIRQNALIHNYFIYFFNQSFHRKA